jgi:hypothetical protein
MEFKRFTKTYPPSDNATIVQQVVFASLLERGFQFVSINDEEKAFQSATSGAFPEISLVHISSKNIISNVVVRSMVVGGNLLVYGRTKNITKCESSSVVTHKLSLPLALAPNNMNISPQELGEHPLFVRTKVHLAYRLVPSCKPIADLSSLTMTRGVWIAAIQYLPIIDIGSLATTCKKFHSSLNNTVPGLWELLLVRDIKGVKFKNKNKNFARDDYKSIIIERVRVKKKRIELEERRKRRMDDELLRRQMERQRNFPSSGGFGPGGGGFGPGPGGGRFGPVPGGGRFGPVPGGGRFGPVPGGGRFGPWPGGGRFGPGPGGGGFGPGPGGGGFGPSSGDGSRPHFPMGDPRGSGPIFTGGRGAGAGTIIGGFQYL